MYNELCVYKDTEWNITYYCIIITVYLRHLCTGGATSPTSPSPGYMHIYEDLFSKSWLLNLALALGNRFLGWRLSHFRKEPFIYIILVFFSVLVTPLKVVLAHNLNMFLIVHFFVVVFSSFYLDAPPICQYSLHLQTYKGTIHHRLLLCVCICMYLLNRYIYILIGKLTQTHAHS